ncbi:DUF86 domain-containing protein [Candidatus Woesearchaeota archaeon]|nr:DUF86 domain-containing protein [Candidatus Woesearchaeota archaeon]
MEKVVVENKIESFINLLEILKNILNEHTRQKDSSLQEYLLYAAEKKAEEIVELAVSVNQELLRGKGKISSSYYESFLDLKLFSVFSDAELRVLAGTAGFRNRLAHEYLEVDPHIALKTMKQMLVMYPPYLQKVKKLLSKL